MTEAELKEFGYLHARQICGVWCTTQDYVTTRALVVGVDKGNCERRYCYQNREDADAALAEYKDPNKHPSGPWIKVKGLFRGRWLDAMNPEWPGEYKPWEVVAPK